MRAIAKGVAGLTIQSKHGADLTGIHLLDIHHLVSVHAHQPRHLYLFASHAVENKVAFTKDPCSHTRRLSMTRAREQIPTNEK